MSQQVDSLREEADRAKRECLEVKKMAEERDILLKQEQAALRKVRNGATAQHTLVSVHFYTFEVFGHLSTNAVVRARVKVGKGLCLVLRLCEG